MTNEQVQTLKTDFLEWTGGFAPEVEDDIEVYVTSSMPMAFNAEDARQILRQWMQEVSQANH